jgi:hypothetical protein
LLDDSRLKDKMRLMTCATFALTLSALAVEHGDWLAGHTIAQSAASAATCINNSHGSMSFAKAQ